MAILLRDVMNSKSDRHFRHSENAYDIKKLSFYYAIESRIFNGIWNDELQKHTRGPLWFTNIMVFDFDFDEAHFPNVEDYQRKLNESLIKLEEILGKPKYKIFNKNKYSKWEIEVYFTKNGKVNLPKKCGCQVVYELTDSIKSQWVESVNLYHRLRLDISAAVDADLNFKGHMFKNPYNKRLFDIHENADAEPVDIFAVAERMGYSNIDRIRNMKAFETFETKNKLPAYLKKWSNMLLSFYQDLNSWKSNSSKVNWKNKMFYIENCKRYDSRNETLFNYFKSIPLSTLETIQYHETLNTNLFDNCSIKEPLDEVEWETTRQSVLNYRKENNIEFVDRNVDSRVFKWDQSPLNTNFFNENYENLMKAAKNAKIYRNIEANWLSTSIPMDLYKGNNAEEILANVFLSYGADKVLTNVRNLISHDMLEFYKDILKVDSTIMQNNNLSNDTYGMWDLYCIIKGALYLTHFKYYRCIQKFRHSKPKREKTKLEIRNEMMSKWGLNYRGSILGFKRFYEKLMKNGLLKSDGSALPISFYQSHFRIRNAIASTFAKLIKTYLSISKLLDKCLKLKSLSDNCKIKMVDVKHSFNQIYSVFNFSINHSQPMNYLIKSFNINCKMFNNRGIRLLYYENNIITINTLYDSINNFIINSNYNFYNYALRKGSYAMNIYKLLKAIKYPFKGEYE